MNGRRALSPLLGLLGTLFVVGCGGGAQECLPDPCSALGAACGEVSDGCGGTVGCGTCAAGAVCSTGNQCVPEGCRPATCSELGAQCGAIDDGCGGTLRCGTCEGLQTCTDNLCSCEPITCEMNDVECGTSVDGCGGFLDCGACGEGEECRYNACVPEGSCYWDMDCGDTETCVNGLCQSVLGRTYRFQILSGAAQEKEWDADGSAPDLFVRFGEERGAYETKVALDSFYPEWGQHADIVLQAGGAFHLDVFEQNDGGDVWVRGWHWEGTEAMALLARTGEIRFGGRYRTERTGPTDVTRVVGPEPDPVMVWVGITPVD